MRGKIHMSYSRVEKYRCVCVFHVMSEAFFCVVCGANPGFDVLYGPCRSRRVVKNIGVTREMRRNSLKFFCMESSKCFA